MVDSSLALKVDKLVKRYKDFTAVDDISFSVKKGEIFGILGPNGAGKTTTLEMIEGLRNRTSGTINLLGKELKSDKKSIKEIQEFIGLQLQSSTYFEYLNLLEILNLFASFYKNSVDPIELLKEVELYEKRNQFVGKLSGGQAQRFSIVAALINDPEIVFLDEPTTGLDPKIRKQIWDLIREINKKGKTVIMTTHYMEEAQELCDRVAVMNEGKIAAVGTPQELIEKLKLPFTVKFIDKNHGKLKVEDYVKSEYISEAYQEKEKSVLKIDDTRNINDVLNWLEDNDVEIYHLEVIPPDLENVFMELTGKKLLNDD